MEVPARDYIITGKNYPWVCIRKFVHEKKNYNKCEFPSNSELPIIKLFSFWLRFREPARWELTKPLLECVSTRVDVLQSRCVYKSERNCELLQSKNYSV